MDSANPAYQHYGYGNISRAFSASIFNSFISCLWRLLIDSHCCSTCSNTREFKPSAIHIFWNEVTRDRKRERERWKTDGETDRRAKERERERESVRETFLSWPKCAIEEECAAWHGWHECELSVGGVKFTQRRAERQTDEQMDRKRKTQYMDRHTDRRRNESDLFNVFSWNFKATVLGGFDWNPSWLAPACSGCASTAESELSIGCVSRWKNIGFFWGRNRNRKKAEQFYRRLEGEIWIGFCKNILSLQQFKLTVFSKQNFLKIVFCLSLSVFYFFCAFLSHSGSERQR